MIALLTVLSLAHNGEIHGYSATCAGSIIAGGSVGNGSVIIADYVMQTAFLISAPQWEIEHQWQLGTELQPIAIADGPSSECALIMRPSGPNLQAAVLCKTHDFVEWHNTTNCPGSVVKIRTLVEPGNDPVIYVMDTLSGNVSVYNHTLHACTLFASGADQSAFEVYDYVVRFWSFDVNGTNVLRVGRSDRTLVFETDTVGIVKYTLSFDLWSNFTFGKADAHPLSDDITHRYGDVFYDRCGDGKYIVISGEVSYDNIAAQFESTLVGKATRIYSDDSFRFLAVGLRHPWQNTVINCSLYIANVGEHRHEGLMIVPTDTSTPLNYRFPFLEHHSVHSLFGYIMEDSTTAYPVFTLDHCPEHTHIETTIPFALYVYLVGTLAAVSLTYAAVNVDTNASAISAAVSTWIAATILYSVPHLFVVTVNSTRSYFGLWYYYQPHMKSYSYRPITSLCPNCTPVAQPSDLTIASIAVAVIIVASPIVVTPHRRIAYPVLTIAIITAVSAILSAQSRVYPGVEPGALFVVVAIIAIQGAYYTYKSWPAESEPQLFKLRESLLD